MNNNFNPFEDSQNNNQLSPSNYNNLINSTNSTNSTNTTRNNLNNNCCNGNNNTDNNGIFKFNINYNNSSYKEFKKKYIEDLERDTDFIPIIFRKQCGYAFLTYFNKRNTINDIYKNIDLLFINITNSNNLYYLKDHSLLHVNRTNIIFKDFVSKVALKPVYDLPTRVVYELWLSDSSHN